MSSYILNTDATTEIITLDDLKTALRIDGCDYDYILEPLIATARQLGEAITGRDFVEKEYKFYLDYFPCFIEVKKYKLTSITSIQYYDTNNTLQTFTDYYLTDEDYCKIYPNSSFPNTYNKKQAVIITFKVDYLNFPKALKQAMIEVCKKLYNGCNKNECYSLFFPWILPQKMII